jgi:hypothetical protein
LQNPVCQLRTYHDFAALGSELHSIVDKVDQNLHDAATVDTHERKV